MPSYAIIANPPNSAQLGGTLYHSPKLHTGAGMWTDTQTVTDAHDHYTFRVIYDSRKM